MLLAAAFTAGCRSAAEHRKQADEEVIKLVESRRAKLAIGDGSFTIEPRPDSLRQRILHGEATSPIELDLVACLEIGAENSREYQRRKEALYLAALDLTLERWRFGWQVPESRVDAGVTGVGDEAQSASASSFFSLRRVLGTGAVIAGNLGLSVARALSFGDGWDPVSDFGLSITQPLLRGSSRAIVEEPLTQAERDLVYAVRDFERFRGTFAVDIANRYYRVLQSRDAVGNQERNAQSLVGLRERNEELARAGRLSDIDVGQARQDELSSQNSLLGARERLAAQQDEFKLALGLPVEVELVLRADALQKLVDAGLPRIEVAEEHAIAIALERRLDHMNAIDIAADAVRRVAVAEDALRIGFELAASTSSVSETDKPLRYDFGKSGWSVAAALDLPIDRLPERNVYRAALIARDAAQRTAELSGDQIRADLRDELRALESRAASYAIQLNAVELARKRIASAQLKLEAGRADTRSLLEAQRSLLDAENAATSALVEYTLARLDLFRDLELLHVDSSGIQIDEAALRETVPAGANP